jgi:hypothetical protein
MEHGRQFGKINSWTWFVKYPQTYFMNCVGLNAVQGEQYTFMNLINEQFMTISNKMCIHTGTENVSPRHTQKINTCYTVTWV